MDTHPTANEYDFSKTSEDMASAMVLVMHLFSIDVGRDGFMAGAGPHLLDAEP